MCFGNYFLRVFTNISGNHMPPKVFPLVFKKIEANITGAHTRPCLTLSKLYPGQIWVGCSVLCHLSTQLPEISADPGLPLTQWPLFTTNSCSQTPYLLANGKYCHRLNHCLKPTYTHIQNSSGHNWYSIFSSMLNLLKWNAIAWCIDWLCPPFVASFQQPSQNSLLKGICKRAHPKNLSL